MKKRIKPNIKTDNPRVQLKSYFGGNNTVSRHISNKKGTIYCNVDGCTYTSRVFFYPDEFRNGGFVHSYKCPKHGNTMRGLGCANELPKNKKKRKKFLKLFKSKNFQLR